MQSTYPKPISRALDQTERFAREIVGLPIPNEPRRLSSKRKNFAISAMEEELVEFIESRTIEDEADALVDMAYFALGRLVEMGLSPTALFDEVHHANMSKKRGELSKRPGSLGYDAIKPEGWMPPDLEQFFVTRDQLAYAQKLTEAGESCLECADSICDVCATDAHPFEGLKFAVIGHARHGKDTVCEFLRDDYGLRFEASSMYCAERVIWPLIQDVDFRDDFISSFADLDKAQQFLKSLKFMSGYANVKQCFEDRGNHRELWYEAISWFNSEDPSRLAKGLLENNDVYCGIRSKRELRACINSGIFDVVIWVDASDRCAPEPKESCTVEPYMADFTIDNNGGVDDLRQNTIQLMEYLQGLFNTTEE